MIINKDSPELRMIESMNKRGKPIIVDSKISMVDAYNIFYFDVTKIPKEISIIEGELFEDEQDKYNFLILDALHRHETISIDREKNLVRVRNYVFPFDLSHFSQKAYTIEEPLTLS